MAKKHRSNKKSSKDNSKAIHNIFNINNTNNYELAVIIDTYRCLYHNPKYSREDRNNMLKYTKIAYDKLTYIEGKVITISNDGTHCYKCKNNLYNFLNKYKFNTNIICKTYKPEKDMIKFLDKAKEYVNIE